MSQLNKTLISIAALAFCAALAAQGPVGGTVPAGNAAVNGALLNQAAAASTATIATCPAGTVPFCTYLAGIQLECNPANPGTGTGSLLGNVIYSDVSVANYTVTLANLPVNTCNTYASASFSGQWLARYLIVRAGTAIQYQVTAAGVTGTYAYDVTWFAIRLT